MLPETLTKYVILAVVAAVAAVCTNALRRSRPLEPAASPHAAGQGPETARLRGAPRQRPGRALKVIGVIFIVVGVVAIPLGSLIPGPSRMAGWAAVAAFGVFFIGIGCFMILSHERCALVDAPDTVVVTTWRGRTTTVRHDEIVSYDRQPRSQYVTVRDAHGGRHNLHTGWFSMPYLALSVACMEAEGRFLPKAIGNPRKVSNRISQAERAFGTRMPAPLRSVLEQGPGSYPERFQHLPSAPAGRGWVGADYEQWRRAVGATLASLG